MHKLIPILAVVVAFSGCSKAPDPTQQFASVASKVSAHLEQELPKKGRRLVEPVKYDVRKTDSLVTPIVADLKYSYQYENKQDVGTLTCQERTDIQYVWREDKWVPVSFKITGEGIIAPKNLDRNIARTLETQWVNRVFGELNEAAIAKDADARKSTGVE